MVVVVHVVVVVVVNKPCHSKLIYQLAIKEAGNIIALEAIFPKILQQQGRKEAKQRGISREKFGFFLAPLFTSMATSSY